MRGALGSILMTGLLLGNAGLGGLYLPDYQATVGPQTLAQLQELAADKVFLGADGLTMGSGPTTANILMAEVDRKMVEQARQVILVADSSKIGRVGFVPIKPVNSIHALITDTNAPPDFVRALRGRSDSASPLAKASKSVGVSRWAWQ